MDNLIVDLKERLQDLRGKLGFPSMTINLTSSGLLNVCAYTACTSPDAVVNALYMYLPVEKVEVAKSGINEDTILIDADVGKSILFSVQISYANLEYSRYASYLASNQKVKHEDQYGSLEAA